MLEERGLGGWRKNDDKEKGVGEAWLREVRTGEKENRKGKSLDEKVDFICIHLWHRPAALSQPMVAQAILFIMAAIRPILFPQCFFHSKILKPRYGEHVERARNIVGKVRRMGKERWGGRGRKGLGEGMEMGGGRRRRWGREEGYVRKESGAK